MNFNLNLNSSIRLPKIKNGIRIVAVLIAALGLGIFWYMSNEKIPEITTKTTQLERSNESLKTQESNLRVLEDSMTYYLEETQRLTDETDELLTEFPTFMYLEDKILYAHDLLEGDLNGYNLSSFSYGESSYKSSVKYGADETMLELYSVGFSGKYQDLTYTKIKEFLDYGLSSPQRFVIKSITMGYNEKTGYISGEFNFDTYFVPGQKTPYEFPEYVIAGLGNSNRVDNLFGARQDSTTNTDDTTVE